MKRSEGNVLLACDKHYQDIVSERSIATIRSGLRTQFKPGEPFYFAMDDGMNAIAVNCKRVTFMQAKEISADEYAMTGSNQQPEEGLRELRQFYPDLKDDDLVTLIVFERI